MIGFLREGMTMLKKGRRRVGLHALGAAEATTALEAVTPTRGVKVEKGTLVRRPLRDPGHGGQGRHGRRLPGPRQAARRGGGPQGPAGGRCCPRTRRMLERFKQEIKLARRITQPERPAHPRFRGERTGTFYISMEFLEGVTLKDLIRSKGALPVGVGLSIAKQMCHGLEAAHEQGVVHRDIKPQNMLILPETGRAQDHGLRHRPPVRGGERRSRLGPHHRRDGDGHARLHAARAGPGRGRGLPLGHLLAGRGAVRDASPASSPSPGTRS